MPDPPAADDRLDAGPTGCGELLLLLHARMRTLAPGQVLEVVAYDPGAREDVPAWCRMVGHTLLAAGDQHYWLRKGAPRIDRGR